VLFAALSVLAPGTAYAATGYVHFALTGSGSITPGLNTVPTNQTGSFSGLIVGTGLAGTGTAVGTGNCNFSFTSTIQETSAQGQGTAAGTCGISGVNTTFKIWGEDGTCHVNYVRAGSNVEITTGSLLGLDCEGTAFGPLGSGITTYAIGEAQCQFVPTSGDGVSTRITEYTLACDGYAAGAL
jgi:hypothetical protein